MAPVSYTHLDVYKRQVEDKAILYSILGEMAMSADVKKGLGYLQASLKDKDLSLIHICAQSEAPLPP